MFRPLSFYIGLRYTAAKRRNHFISFISLTSMIGLMLGVAVLIIVLSVMNGFDRELKQRILGMVPHAVIQGNPDLDDWHNLLSKKNDPQTIMERGSDKGSTRHRSKSIDFFKSVN